MEIGCRGEMLSAVGQLGLGEREQGVDRCQVHLGEGC